MGECEREPLLPINKVQEISAWQESGIAQDLSIAFSIEQESVSGHIGKIKFSISLQILFEVFDNKCFANGTFPKFTSPKDSIAGQFGHIRCNQVGW